MDVKRGNEVNKGIMYEVRKDQQRGQCSEYLQEKGKGQRDKRSNQSLILHKNNKCPKNGNGQMWLKYHTTHGAKRLTDSTPGDSRCNRERSEWR